MHNISIILILLILIPLFSGFYLLLDIKKNNSVGFFFNTRETKLLTFFDFGRIVSTGLFILSLFLWILFDNAATEFQFLTIFSWSAFLNINFVLGIDGISLFFIILTTFLTMLCLWSVDDMDCTKSVNNIIKQYAGEFVSLFLLMEALLIIVFTILDLLLFYIFFESILIPMFLIIGIWGSRSRRIRAAYQFFFYTLVGSVFMLLAIVLIYLEVGTTDFHVLFTHNFDFKKQLILWFAFFMSFAVKVPMIPFHIWLPEAHVEAPTTGSVILAGILLKLGTYGFLRFSLSLFPDASIYFAPFIFLLSIISIIYGSLTTLRQVDLKRVIAYSSVAHMGYVTLGLFTYNMQGIEGSILLMLSHGLVSGALFFCVGVLYDRYHTRLVKYYSGLVQIMPLFAAMFFFFILANISFPGTSNFVGELLVLIGIFQVSTVATLLASLGMILGAAYSLWMYNRVFFGKMSTNIYNYWQHLHFIVLNSYNIEKIQLSKKILVKTYLIKNINNLDEKERNALDVDATELSIFLWLGIAVIWMGIYPEIFLISMHTSVAKIILHTNLFF